MILTKILKNNNNKYNKNNCNAEAVKFLDGVSLMTSYRSFIYMNSIKCHVASYKNNYTDKQASQFIKLFCLKTFPCLQTILEFYVIYKNIFGSIAMSCSSLGPGFKMTIMSLRDLSNKKKQMATIIMAIIRAITMAIIRAITMAIITY